MLGVALVMMALGYTLTYSGIKGFNPASVILSAFTGQPPQYLAGAGPSAISGGASSGGAAPTQSSGGFASSATGNKFGNQIISAAMAFNGAPYKLGGTTRQGIDCSGLTQRAYAAVGISLAHFAATQYVQCVKITKGALSPGDLIFMPLGETLIQHVAICVVPGKSYLEAAPSHGVGVVDWGYQRGPYFYGRPKKAFVKKASPHQGPHPRITSPSNRVPPRIARVK